MYGRRFPQSNTGTVSDIQPKNGLTHQGAAMIPYPMVISTGVNLRSSIISKSTAMLPKDRQKPKVK